MQAGVPVTERNVILESYLEVTGLQGLLNRRSGHTWVGTETLETTWDSDLLYSACPQHAQGVDVAAKPTFPVASEGEVPKLLAPRRYSGMKGSPTQQTLLHLIGQGCSYSWERREHEFLAFKPHMEVVAEYHNIACTQEERPWHSMGWDL